MMPNLKADRRQKGIGKTNTCHDNHFFYKETFFGDENFSNSDEEEDTETLRMRARNLVNDEFRLMTLNPDNNPENCDATPKQSYMKLSVKKKIESVKDARKKIQQEWDMLKNASLMEGDSESEKSRPKDPHKEILHGVVVYIDIEQNKRLVSLLPNLLKSMGATVLNSFAQEVTHVVYKNGTNKTFKRAKLLNAFLVSVLWVEACYTTGYRVNEKLYPVLTENKYCHSPRVFRKNLESRKDLQLELLQMNQQEPQSTNQMKNIDKINTHPTTSSEISGIVRFEEPTKKAIVMKTTSENHNNSSDDSIRLHLSTDDSNTNESNADEFTEKSTSMVLTNKQDDPKGLLSTDPSKGISSNLGGQIDTNINSVPVNSKNISPHKRKLFDRFPLQTSYISNDRESTDSLNFHIKNPYQICEGQNEKMKKRDAVDKHQSSSNRIFRKPQENSEKLDEGQTTVKIKPSVSRLNKTPPKRERIFKNPRSSGRSPRKNYMPPSAWPKLVCTSFHSHENESLIQSISKLGKFRWASKVDKFTTHVVAGRPVRTINLLKAVARGCWIVSRDWVLQSEIAGRWVAEDIYELAEFSQIVRRSRTQKQVLGKEFSLDIFDDCGTIHISRDTDPPYKDLRELVSLCGGTVSPRANDANIIVGKVENQKCVSVKWILDSITCGRYKSIERYYLND